MDPTIAARSLGPVGCVPLHGTLCPRYVPSNLQKRYRKWREESGGGGVAPPMEWEYTKCWTLWYVMGR